MCSFYLEYSNLESSILEMMNPNPQSSIAEISDTKKAMENNGSEFLQSMIAEIEIPNLPSLLAAVSWTKNIVIIQKCKDYLERIFYIKAARRFGWTTNVLAHNIDVKAYERYLTNQTNFDDAVSAFYGWAWWAVNFNPLKTPHLKCVFCPLINLTAQ